MAVRMQVTLWEEGKSQTISIDEIERHLNSSCWIDITDPGLEDLDRLSELTKVTDFFEEDQHSNYPHVDTYLGQIKMFSWYLLPPRGVREQSFLRSPVIVLMKKTSVITISHSRVGVIQRISSEFSKGDRAESIAARVTCAALMCLLESYEDYSEDLERRIDTMEKAVPPWPKESYAEAFGIRRETGSLLRLLRHFRILTESFVKGGAQTFLVESELPVMNSIQHRAMGLEETAETMLDTVRDLTSLHLDTVSHETNRAMRLLASITALVAFPSVFGSLLGMNLSDVPWPWQLWQIVALSLTTAVLLAIYFFKKGWLR